MSLTRENGEKMASVVRAARKRAGMTQKEIARLLGLSQGKISKIETGLLSMEAFQWIEFCEALRIPPNSILKGFIDIPGSILVSNIDKIGKYRIPKRYSQYAGSTARVARPFMDFFSTLTSPARLHEFLRYRDIDPDYFVQLDNPINMRFTMDLLRELSQQSLITMTAIDRMANIFVKATIHSPFEKNYTVTNPIDRIESLINNLPYYEQNHEYLLLSRTQNKATISVTPKAHVVELGVPKEVGSFLSAYYGRAFQKFAAKNIDPNVVSLEQVECFYKSAKRCLYHITTGPNT